MKKEQRSAGQSLVNAQSFLKSHPEVAVLADTPAAKQLDAAITDFKTSVATQASATLDVEVHRQRLAELARTIIGDYMKPAAAFSRKSLKGAADYAALTRSARGARATQKLANEARAMATAAAPVTADFTAAKFDPGFITKLGGLADDLETALQARQTNQDRGMHATKGISSALTRGREALATLDPVVTKLLKSSDLLVVWRSVKRVRAAASTTPTVTPTPTPAATPIATPATTGATSTTEVKAA